MRTWGSGYGQWSGDRAGLIDRYHESRGRTSDNAITRKPVLTLYPDRPAEIGIPAENPRLQGPGVVITGFVNRIGDPRGVVAADGSLHRGEVLIADALRALAHAATGGRPCPTTSR